MVTTSTNKSLWFMDPLDNAAIKVHQLSMCDWMIHKYLILFLEQLKMELQVELVKHTYEKIKLHDF